MKVSDFMKQKLIALALPLLFAGCSLAPRYSVPAFQAPGTYKELTPEPVAEAARWKDADPKDGKPRGKWWEVFESTELNALEVQVTASNQSVAAALANFQASRAVVKQVRSQYFPNVTAGPAVTRARTSTTAARAPSTATLFALPFDASWEADLWGRIRNSVTAGSFEAQAVMADLENLRLTVQAEAAVDYFDIRVLDSQKRLLDDAVLTDQESLRLTQIEADTGLLCGTDIELAETQLELARAQATDVGVLRAQLEHAVAALAGKSASSFSIAVSPEIGKPVTIPSGVPSQLLERRPDIAASERRVAEANAQIGVARAAYFPTVMLGASSGLQSVGLGSLFSGPGLVWSVGAALAQTLFDGGKRKAVTAQAKANYEITVANYRQTVLTAFQEVEDNLATLSILERELRQQNAAVESSHRSVTLVTERYDSGLDNYLVVTAAQTILLTNKRTALNLNTQQMTASVQLIKALGGGWDASNLPSVKDIGR